MADNIGYLVIQGTSGTNTVDNAVFAIEQSVKKTWKTVWTSAHPFFTLMNYRGNHVNKGFSESGTSIIIPVIAGKLTQAAAVVDISAELTSDSGTNANTPMNFAQAQYHWAHLRGHYTLRESDMMLSKSGERGSLLTGMRNQILNSFKDVISTALVANLTAPTITTGVSAVVPSIRSYIHVSNTIGGISQSAVTDWRGVVNSSYGAFDLDAPDTMLDTINAKGRSKVDFFLASSSSVNVYSKFRAHIAPGERYTNTDFTTKSGLDNYMYRGATVLMDNRNTASELLGISSDTWYVKMPDAPTLVSTDRVKGTDAFETMYKLWVTVGIDDPGCNGRYVFTS